MAVSDPGQFVISIDTELSWGTFDLQSPHREAAAYRDVPATVDGLCELFDAYDVPATWALVAHLLEDCHGHAEFPPPEYDRVDWFDAAPCSIDVDRDLWYAPELLERIRSSAVDHEIAAHGYSHVIIGEPGCTRETARAEVEAAMRVFRDAGVDPETYVFPRNQVGHLDVVRDAGIRYVRFPDARWYEDTVPRPAVHPIRIADAGLQRAPPVVSPRRRDGLVELPGSQVLRPYDRVWSRVPGKFRLARLKKGLDRAARTGDVFHLWFHPFALAPDRDRHLATLERAFEHAESLREDGRLEVATMASVASEC